MRSALLWALVWFLVLVWSLGIRPFIPLALPIEPFVPLLVASLMLGPWRIIVPLLLISSFLFEAFQPFPQPSAFFVFFMVAVLVWLAIRFVLATRSYYSALILTVVSRAVIAGLVFLLGTGAAVFQADKTVLLSPIFLLLTTLSDAILLLVGFLLVSRPLLGAKRVQIAR